MGGFSAWTARYILSKSNVGYYAKRSKHRRLGHVPYSIIHGLKTDG